MATSGLINIGGGSSTPIRVNNSFENITGLYDVALIKFAGNFEFFQDSYFRFDHSTNAFRIASVGVSRNTGVYGLNSGSTTATLPVTTDADFIGKGGYSSIAVGVFTTISDTGISNDYDDIQTFWVMTSTAPVKYRVTIMGGSSITAIVERWDFSSLATNTKITLS